MEFRVFIERKAQKQIEKLSNDVKPRVFATLNELEIGFSARLDIKKLQGTKNHYRIRVGDYRILFVLEGSGVYVYDVSHRHSVYDRM